jgi:tetratricopeptide (TPR) repeat protein
MRDILRILGAGLLLFAASPALAQDSPAAKPKPDQKAAQGKGDRGLDDVPANFVPLHPRSTEDRDRVEALRLFAAARALEDRHQLSEALTTLEKARKLNPDAPAILRRLSRLNLVLGRNDQAVAVARRLIELDPGDAAAIALLVGHYLERKADPAGAEATLKKIAANPKLKAASPGYLLVHRVLGDLASEVLNKPREAADAYAKLMHALDDPAANGLSPADRQRVVEGDEASSYLKFGDAFLKANQFALAVQAFRRGLVYKPDHATLPRLLAQALAGAGERAEALRVLEAYLKRQPAGNESYDLLGEILDSMGRGTEVLPRLESAAKADSKNLRLKFLVAERLRAEAQGDKADAMLADLLKRQADPQVYAALAQSYKKERKADDLVRIMGEALERPGGFEAVRPTIEALADDPDMAAKCLDAGTRMVAAKPSTLTLKARQMLAIVAGRSKMADKLVTLDRAAVSADPSAANRKQVALDLYLGAKKYDESAAALIELFAKHPAEKTGMMVTLLARAHFFGGKLDPALEAAKEARAIDPSNVDGLAFLAFVLGQLGRDDQAIAVYEDMLKRFSTDDEVVKRARSGLSTCYVNKGDFTRGEAELEIIYRKDPDDPMVNNDLGYLYADQGKNLDKAEAMIRKALEDQPDNGSYLDSLGWCLFKQGKVQEALVPLEKAYKSDNNDLTICDHLGDVFFHIKDFARAKESWKKAEEFAAKTSPPSKRLPEVRKKLAELDKLGPPPKPTNSDGP